MVAIAIYIYNVSMLEIVSRKGEKWTIKWNKNK